MRKLIAIIIILVIILIGMIGYKNVVIKNTNISIQEIERIEDYMQQIYMWKEITGEALPCFEEVNQADENWAWEVVKKNLEEYEVSHEQIQEKAKELLGEKWDKQFPKEGTDYLTYDEQNNVYYAEEVDLDQKEDAFLLNKIEKIENGYEIEIVEYLEDYSQASKENQIIIRNLKEEEIKKVKTEEEEQVKEIVKEQIDKLSKKKVILKVENGKLCIEKVYQE